MCSYSYLSSISRVTVLCFYFLWSKSSFNLILWMRFLTGGFYILFFFGLIRTYKYTVLEYFSVN